MSKKITKMDKVRELLIKNPAMKIDALVNQSGVNRPMIHVYLAKARKELGLKSRQDIVRERKAYAKKVLSEAKASGIPPRTITLIPRPEPALPVHMTKRKAQLLSPTRLEMSADMPITMIEPKADMVNHPPHYKVGGIETIDFIEAKQLNYNLGNAVKYITRADHKGARKQDLEKAVWYLQREINNL